MLFAKQSRPCYQGKKDFRVLATIQPGTREGKAENFLVRRAGREEWCVVQLATVVIFDFPRFPIVLKVKLCLIRPTFLVCLCGVQRAVFGDFEFEWPTPNNSPKNYLCWPAKYWRLLSCFLAFEVWRANANKFLGKSWALATKLKITKDGALHATQTHQKSRPDQT